MIAKCSKKSECTSSGSGTSATSRAMTSVPGVFIAASSCARAEQPGRAEQQDGEEDDEDADPPEILAEEEAAERFGQPNDEAADQRADEAAHAAEHDDGEGDDDEALADAGMSVIARQQEAGGGADAGDADAEAHGEDMLDVDADQARALALAGHRADRLAEIGPLDDEPEQGGDDESADERDELGHGEEGDADIDRVEGIARVDRPRVRAPEIEREIVDDDGEAERHQQDIVLPAVARRGDDRALQRIAQHEHRRNDDRQSEIGIDAEERVEEIDAVERQHQQAAMGEIDDVQHAVDQRQPERHQRVNRAGGDAVQHRREHDLQLEHYRP